MPRTLTCRSAAYAVAVLAVTAGPASAADDPADVTITAVQSWAGVFGGREVERSYRVAATRPVTGRVTLRFAVGPRTALAREFPLAARPGQPDTITVKLPVPPVKDGIVFPAAVRVAAVEAGGTEPVATLGQDLWVYPDDPFAGRAAWLKGLGIIVYDPPGATAQLLTRLDVPFEERHTPAALTEVDSGVLLVGEGTTFGQEPGLADVLAAAAVRGAVVVVLAPASGRVTIPGVGSPADGIDGVTFTRDIVRTLGKRLDPAGWPSDGTRATATLTVNAADGTIGGEVSAGPTGWPWVEAKCGRTGRWAFCGYPVIARWDAGPAPRFFLARVLESLTAKPDPDPEPTK